jgi:sorting and assembly machinery component 37
MLPIPQRYYVPGRIRESFRPRLEAAQLWNLPGIEEEVKFWERSRLNMPKEEDQKAKFKRVFEREKVICRMASAVSARLIWT